ncbi:MAG TPA: S41 family peptidase [Bacteroidia bacterium]|nr:S41 family peptidase [Bacteroidia bacterium]
MNNRSGILVALCLFILPHFSQAQPGSQSRKYDALMQIINYAYVDTPNEEKLTETAIRAVLKDLDPHSVYIPADELKQTNEPLVGKFEGVGIQFNIFEDTIMVTQPISGGPSEKVGIRAGDRIVKIDSENVASIKITNADVMKKLRGDKGTKVTVDIYRRGEPELLEYVITRDKIPLFSVDASYMATPTIGYIKISKFADTTVDEFKQALAKLKAQGLQSLILDLSGNGGGYLNRAVGLADEFLSAGKRIVYTQGRNNPMQEYNSTEEGGFESGKLVVLVDESSASASEIVSGAIQDWDRGLLIGRRTFAKGLVQNPYSLPDGSAIRLTVARYYTPSGRCIQKSYEDGEEAYEQDFSRRYEHGELYSADSIHFNDSLKYFTSGKRVVYGGGGIMPDVFVPLDTTWSSKYHTELIRKSVMLDFALNYADSKREQLKKTYPTANSFVSNFKVSDALLNEMVEAGVKKGIEKDSAGLARSGATMKVQLKALIARDLYNYEAYWQVINQVNDFYLKAIECLQDDTFNRMKISSR